MTWSLKSYSGDWRHPPPAQTIVAVMNAIVFIAVIIGIILMIVI